MPKETKARGLGPGGGAGLECGHCGARFAQECSRRRHVAGRCPAKKDPASFAGPADLSCGRCGRRFKSRLFREKHVNRAIPCGEGGVAPGDTACPDCGKEFASSRALMAHLRDVCGKEGYRPHPCPACPAWFRRAGHLAAHLRTHDSEDAPEKPHKCGGCGRGFGKPCHVARHWDTGACPASPRHEAGKAAACPECGARFRTFVERNRHRAACAGRKIQEGLDAVADFILGGA